MYKKLLLAFTILILISLFYFFDLSQYFAFDYLKDKQIAFNSYYAKNPFLVIILYFVIYVLISALSLPGAAVMTLIAGSIFGLFLGVVLVSIASTVGATAAFLISKYILYENVQNKYGHKLHAINEGIKKEGAYYLFALRLVPVMPFFIINLLMGVTSITTGKFFLVSQLGMLPGTILYVFVGTTIAELSSVSNIISWPILMSFTLLGIFPILAKKALPWGRNYFLMRKYKKPKKFDYNIVIIGGGPGGLVAAYMSSQMKAKTALIEKNLMGGDCLNTGCVPSKALIKTAKIMNYQNHFSEYGLSEMKANGDFKSIMQRVKSVIKKIQPHDSSERYTKLGVKCIKGSPKILDPYRIKINNKIITSRNLIIATGARPFVPDIPGIDQIKYLTSDNIWELEEKPKEMVVLGGGPIGVELAQAFNRIGIKITIIEKQHKILLREDSEVSDRIYSQLIKEGINIQSCCSIKEIVKKNNKKYIVCEHKGKLINIEFDEILVALGRRANTKGFGLEELGVELTDMQTIKSNDYMQTNFPNIYVCGDVTGPFQFTHSAGYQGMLCSLNSLLGWLKRFKADYRVLPLATFTDPEIARVGINEKEAMTNNLQFDVTTYSLSELDRAIIEGADEGFIKIITAKNSDQILGVTIIGENAGELIAEFVLAMQYNLGLNKILKTIHVYPTMNEANKAAAGYWRKNHTNIKLLEILSKIFAWQRG